MKMKSKSTQNKSTTVEKPKPGNNYDFLQFNKPFDFVGFYKTAAETSKILEKYNTDDTSNKDSSKSRSGTPKREHSPYKNKKRSKQEPIDISQINIDASCFNSGTGARAQLNSPKVTSTPNGSAKSTERVKSIMKNTSICDQSGDSPRSSASGGKPKKRNKSVSFMLDDNEEVVVKRTKSDDSIKVVKRADTVKANVKVIKRQFKNVKKDQQSEKENKASDVNKQNMDVDSASANEKETKSTKVPKAKKLSTTEQAAAVGAAASESPIREKKKKLKKTMKHKPETMETESNNNEVTPEIKNKKLKKKKQSKQTAVIDKGESGDGDDEPVPKSRKKNPKPDIAEDLENLSIGDNAHTLTNMLDEMTVVDKDKRKKLRQKFNKTKRPKGPLKDEVEKPEEVKEKVKWKKRKWNKDRKGDLNDESLASTVFVENLPISIMLDYKKLLTDHFAKHGSIKKIGVAEVHPTDKWPSFTTTVNFNSEAAAELALGENNIEFHGSHIRIKRPLPATETTVVVRSYADLTDQNISTTFLGIGKIRNIKHLIKGKKSMSTSFVEFDGPQAVERAITKMADVKIEGKRIHVAKFKPRNKQKKEKKPKNDDSAADADSEDSND